MAIYTRIVMSINKEYHMLDKALQQVKRYSKIGNITKARKWLNEAEKYLQKIEEELRKYGYLQGAEN